jgi:protein-disulfide isomerase
LQTCMESPATYARAEVDVEEARSYGIRGTPGYVVDGKRLEPDQLQQLLNDR